ncbi:hypothetical protein NQ117_18265 [Paenibacillus sp. SC116]|uniref:hypothetical protein n=1 Tax=Paenibacillus sp. SC116 TaxID=2968986 RepID=UPI00215AD282|nr:hypothetical protein [Paenibacillus sp. SC116]MCR8845632.1 hypothetical protein [Paenibacillus sp. SC116]
MKYFPYDQYIAQHTETTSDEELEQIEQRWQQNGKQYSEIYQSLAERLPEEVYRHFSKLGFHGYRLLKVDVEHESLLRSNAHFTLSRNGDNIENSPQWMLSCDNISFFQFEHHNYDNPRPIMHPEKDNWLFEEFTPVDESTISLEVLFESGGNIRIHFPDRSIRIERIK